MSTAFTESLHHVLLNLRQRGGGPKQGHGTFPAEIAGKDIRVGDNEPPEQWFRRLVGDYLGGDLWRCQIEDNLALFLQLTWGDGRILEARVQAFAVVGGRTLAEVYGCVSRFTRYLRYDYDEDEWGDLYSHPFPHVHPQPDDAPRFPFKASESCLSLIEFFEFLYLNFNHRSWLEWATTVAKERATLIEELISLIRSDDLPESKRKVIRKFATARKNELSQVLGSLRKAKREMPFALECDLGELELLNYLG